MWRRIFMWLIAIGLVCIVFWAVYALPQYLVGVHQRSVTQELANWKTEYGSILSHHDAVRTAEMLEYVQCYYVPGEGYHSTPEIESALQFQRHDTIDSFVASLREYSGEDFGTYSDKWLASLNSIDPKDDSEEE